MKKLIFASVIFAVLITLAACGRSDMMNDDVPNQEVDWEWEQEQDNSYNPNYSKEGKDKPFIDYASYDDYGEWSCDRMWVRKTEKTWDSVTEYLGYIDTNGNPVGEWHPVADRDDSDNFRNLSDAWMYMDNPPNGIHSYEYAYDFKGGFAVNHIGTYQDSGGTYTATYCPILEVTNKNGEIVHRFLPIGYSASDIYDAIKYEFSFVNYLPVFYSGTTAKYSEDGSYLGETTAMYMLLPSGDDITEVLIEGSTGENGWYDTDHFWYDMNNRAFIGDYCSMISGGSAYLFDKTGKTVFEIEFDYKITKLYADDETVYMCFIGADNETTYCVEMDFEGNWLTEPTVSE